MANRKKQFNLTTARYSDEVYAYIEHLSKTRKLSNKVFEWAKAELRGTYSTPPTPTKKENDQKDVHSELEVQVQSLQTQLELLLKLQTSNVQSPPMYMNTSSAEESKSVPEPTNDAKVEIEKQRHSVFDKNVQSVSTDEIEGFIDEDTSYDY